MRRIFAFGMALTLCSMVMAGPAAAIIGFGIKGGLNIADLSELESIDTVDELEQESKTGFVGGGFVKFPLGALRLQVEGLYSLKGSKGTSRGQLGTIPWEVKLTYFEVPVLLKYEFPTPLLKPFLYGGASVAFLMKAEGRNDLIDTDWADIKDDMKSTDYGLVVGGGVRMLGITVEARYTHGLTDTVDQKSGNLLVDQAKNKTWSVMAGFDFF